MNKLLLLCLLVCGFCGHSQNFKSVIDAAEKEAKGGNFEKAIASLDKAIAENQSAYELYHARGKTRSELEQFQEAIDDYAKALQLNPKSAEILISRGLLLSALGYPDEALADAANALDYATSEMEKNTALTIRADSKRAKHDFAAAIIDYETVLGNKPDSGLEINSLLGIAKAFGAQQKNAEAIVYLERLTKAYPKLSIGFTNLAFRYAETGNYKKAIELNDKVIAIEQNTPKNANDETKINKKVIVKGSSLAIALAYNNKGYAQYKLGDTAAALASINHSIELYLENSYAFRNRALVHIAMKNSGLACADIEKSLALGFTQSYGDEVEKLKNSHCKK